MIVNSGQQFTTDSITSIARWETAWCPFRFRTAHSAAFPVSPSRYVAHRDLVDVFQCHDLRVHLQHMTLPVK